MMECERPNVTGNLKDVSDICKWAVNQLKIALAPTGMTVRRIICDATIVRQNAISCFKKARKSWSGKSTIVEERLIEWVWEIYVSELCMADGHWSGNFAR